MNIPKEEYYQLRGIWNSATDYLMGLEIPEFAEEFGGLPKLLEDLRKAVSKYEDN